MPLSSVLSAMPWPFPVRPSLDNLADPELEEVLARVLPTLDGPPGEDPVGAEIASRRMHKLLEGQRSLAALHQALEAWRYQPSHAMGVLIANWTAEQNPQLALQAWERVLRCEPIDPMSWGARGELKMKLGDLEGALQDLSKAAQEAPDSPFPLMSRAEVYEKLGNAKAAQQDRQRAAKFLGPQFHPITRFFLFLWNGMQVMALIAFVLFAISVLIDSLR